MKPSKTLLRTEVSENGLKSLSADFSLDVFAIGRTSGRFHDEGTNGCIKYERNLVGNYRRKIL